MVLSSEVMGLSASLAAMAILSPGGSVPSARIFFLSQRCSFCERSRQSRAECEKGKSYRWRTEENVGTSVFFLTRGGEMEESTRKSCNN